MKATGFAHGNLYRIRQGPYKVVVCSIDRKTAEEAFDKWLKTVHVDVSKLNRFVKATNNVNRKGGEPLLYAFIDVTKP